MSLCVSTCTPLCVCVCICLSLYASMSLFGCVCVCGGRELANIEKASNRCSILMVATEKLVSVAKGPYAVGVSVILSAQLCTHLDLPLAEPRNLKGGVIDR